MVYTFQYESDIIFLLACICYSIQPSPHLCMKYDYMFLSLIIPGPDHPGKGLNVMMQPLIDDLKKLWEGVEAYDCYKKMKRVGKNRSL